MIFVFGSNEAGIHGAGAARFAVENHGAIMMQGEGPQGNSYAIPTKGKRLAGRRIAVGPTLPLTEIKKHVDLFIKYAETFKGVYEFQITQIGCGYAGIQAIDIAPLFADAPDNCLFDEAWKDLLGDGKRYWGTFPPKIPPTSVTDDQPEVQSFGDFLTETPSPVEEREEAETDEPSDLDTDIEEEVYEPEEEFDEDNTYQGIPSEDEESEPGYTGDGFTDQAEEEHGEQVEADRAAHIEPEDFTNEDAEAAEKAIRDNLPPGMKDSRTN